MFLIFGIYTYFCFQAEDGIRVYKVTGVQTCALPISSLTVCATSVRVSVSGLYCNAITARTAADSASRRTKPHLARRGEKGKIGRASCRERVWIAIGAVSCRTSRTTVTCHY